MNHSGKLRLKISLRWAWPPLLLSELSGMLEVIIHVGLVKAQGSIGSLAFNLVRLRSILFNGNWNMREVNGLEWFAYIQGSHQQRDKSIVNIPQWYHGGEIKDTWRKISTRLVITTYTIKLTSPKSPQISIQTLKGQGKPAFKHRLAQQWG